MNDQEYGEWSIGIFDDWEVDPTWQDLYDIYDHKLAEIKAENGLDIRSWMDDPAHYKMRG